MNLKLFGFRFGRKQEPDTVTKSFTVPVNEDGALTIEVGPNAAYSKIIYDLEGTILNEIDLINKYRNMALDGMVQKAIEEVVNDMIVSDQEAPPVEIIIGENLKFSDELKLKIKKEFKNVLRLLNFNNQAYNLVRRWYIDGKLFHHVLIDEQQPQLGIREVRFIDPRLIKKIREVVKERDPKTGQDIITNEIEYYVYNKNGFITTTLPSDRSASGERIHPDTIIFTHSGVLNSDNTMVLSYLHNAIRPYNQLRAMEDAAVIYRVTRATERRIFNVDVGDMPPNKAKQYLQDIMNQFRQKLVYNPSTGEIRDDRKHMTMLEDFWFPKRGEHQSEVTTLAGGCLAMDTKIPLLDGRELSLSELTKEYKEGKQNWIYSCNSENGEVAPGKISWAGVTQKSAKVIKLTLDNQQTIICTPDHKFPIIGKGFVPANNLVIGESLIPLNKQKMPLKKGYKSEYEFVYQNSIKEYIPTHKIITSFFKEKGIQKEIIYDYNFINEKKTVVHHQDFNKFNNNPDNLVLMGSKDHYYYHSHQNEHLKKIGLKGAQKAKERLEKIKQNDPEKYQKILKEQSFKMKEWHSNLQNKKKHSKNIKKYYSNLTGNEKEKHIKKCQKNVQKAKEQQQYLINNDLDYRNHISEKRKEFWKNVDPAWLENYKKETSERNKILFKNPEYKEKIYKNQRIKFNKKILDYITSLCKGKTTHQLTSIEILDDLNNNEEILNLFLEDNKNTKCANWNNDKFNQIHLIKLAKSFGYKNWKQYRKEVECYNHQIIKIEYLPNEIEVGTLTIDQNEEYHGYHTFALSVGVFTKNSNLSEIEDIEYFQKQLYKSLCVPVTRLDPEMGFALGRASEISRQEVNFSRFITRLRHQFSHLFDEVLKRQLILKKITTPEDWESIKDNIYYDFLSDSHFAELKTLEIFKNRLEVLDQADSYIDKYFSTKYVKSNILMQSDQEIKDIQNEIDGKKEEEPEEETPEDQDASSEEPIDLGGEEDQEAPPSGKEIEEPEPESIEVPKPEEK